MRGYFETRGLINRICKLICSTEVQFDCFDEDCEKTKRRFNTIQDFDTILHFLLAESLVSLGIIKLCFQIFKEHIFNTLYLEQITYPYNYQFLP